ncbi:MAG: hypothetical protein H6Q90_2608 [Deltaproteobacteria bacterium]|nr:hypothetical protein [Deltaproteobacteria bacterium]
MATTTGTGALADSGVLAVVFGALVLAVPGSGVRVLVWMIGALVVVLGVLAVAAALDRHGRPLPIPHRG